MVNISSDPDFYHSEWKKNKGALFPVSALNSQDTPSISEQETFYKNFVKEEFFSSLSLGERNKYFFSPQGLQYISALRENYILTKTPHLAIEVLRLFLGDNRNSEEISKDSYASALDKSLNDHRRSLSAQFYGECLKGDCKNGNGTFLVYNCGRIYKGSFKNFKANGKGTLQGKDEIQTLNFVDGYSQD